MPSATRLNDSSTGHDDCRGTPLSTGSENVFINGRSAGRQGDAYQEHSCGTHSPHRDFISGGSATVRINGKPVARAGDPVDMAGSVDGGSADVRIGG